MVQKTVLKVHICCEKCKKKLLKAVSGLQGVDKIEIDGSKGTLTVTGDADPYEIIVRTRKVSRCVEVVSIGPPPEPDAPKKPDEKKPDQNKPAHMLCSCPVYHQVPVFHMDHWEQPNSSCNIL